MGRELLMIKRRGGLWARRERWGSMKMKKLGGKVVKRRVRVVRAKGGGAVREECQRGQQIKGVQRPMREVGGEF